MNKGTEMLIESLLKMVMKQIQMSPEDAKKLLTDFQEKVTTAVTRVNAVEQKLDEILAILKKEDIQNG